jgi:TolB-like protein
MSLIAELRRRNIFRVGIAYVICAWVIAQVADLVLDNIEAPDWVMQAIMLILAIGLPLVLIFAWAFELTPEGIKRDTAVDPDDSVRHATGRRLDFIIIGFLVLAVAYFAVDKFVLESEPEQAGITPKLLPVTESVAREKSIAVLPFVNMSSDLEQEYFSDGLSEEILNLLAKVPKLKVIGRTSSFAFKGKNEDLRVIGQTLGVTTVLEGSVRTSGDRIRVTAQLIDVSDGSHLWSETYDRTMSDIFAIQDDVAAAIIDALQIHVGTKPTRGRPTDNTEAYALFFQARISLNAKGLEKAEEILLKVVELDPNFAEAYELLAFCYWEQSGWRITEAEGMKLIGEAAAKALAINPDLAFAQALFGSASNFSWLGEIQGLERALREEPGKTEVVEALGWNLLNVGYLQEALGVAEGYVDRDPLLPAANYRLGNALYALGRTSEAVAAWERADQLDHIFAKWFIANANLVDKRDDIAIAHYEAWMQEYGFSDSSWLRELVTGARDPATGLAYLDRRIPQIAASVPAEDASELQGIMDSLYLELGYLDRYFEELFDIALDSGWEDAAMGIWHGTVFRRTGFTAHPKYLEVAEANGFVELWEQRGPPDFCNKESGQWVCE